MRGYHVYKDIHDHEAAVRSQLCVLMRLIFAKAHPLRTKLELFPFKSSNQIASALHSFPCIVTLEFAEGFTYKCMNYRNLVL